MFTAECLGERYVLELLSFVFLLTQRVLTLVILLDKSACAFTSISTSIAMSGRHSAAAGLEHDKPEP